MRGESRAQHRRLRERPGKAPGVTLRNGRHHSNEIRALPGLIRVSATREGGATAGLPSAALPR